MQWWWYKFNYWLGQTNDGPISASKRRVFIADQNIMSMDKIPAELMINFDQTALSYVPASHWTMEWEGSKRVGIIAKDNKRQLTVVLQIHHLETFTTAANLRRKLLQFQFLSTLHGMFGMLQHQRITCDLLIYSIFLQISNHLIIM